MNGKASKVQTDIPFYNDLKGQNHPMQVEKGNKNFVDNNIYLL